ncbi:hypothetical protein J6I90_08250 [Pseudidiomarina sp. 1APP75-32.1]|uniref:Uncharacterized protein n=1 Tax=Pseudidiomarina terrestris TaxID=2820060 RepID=A0AAW7QXI3_9GAMM|nr:hypothetical protein [Pseudidiomarina sp. 1APP75-32.1]MDN7124871.1 hypothetical protein [Pseudidiomarina sp. 1APP75-32.1]
MENIFAQYQIDMPKAYQEKIKNFVSTGSQSQSRENAPFDRQIDFWFMALCLAFNKGLTAVKEKETYNAITAEILSRNPYRVTQMQMIALSVSMDPNILLEPKRMLDICVGLANAGIPLLINILSDTEATPLWNIYYELEDIA